MTAIPGWSAQICWESSWFVATKVGFW